MGLMFRALFYAKKGGESSRSHPPKNEESFSPTKSMLMIIFVKVKLKDLFAQSRHYPWKRPSCPKCGCCITWVHEYVPRLFDGFDEPLLLIVFRCPNCGCIIRMHPKSHFSRCQSPIKTIRSSLDHRLTHGKWLPGQPQPSTARMRHWLRNLKKQTRAHLTERWKSGLIEAFDRLMALGKNPVSRAI